MAGVPRETVIVLEAAAKQVRLRTGHDTELGTPLPKPQVDIGFERTIRILRALGLCLACGASGTENSGTKNAGSAENIGSAEWARARGAEGRVSDETVEQLSTASHAEFHRAGLGPFASHRKGAPRWERSAEADARRFEIEEFSSNQRELLKIFGRRYVCWFSGEDAPSASVSHPVESNPGRVLCQAMDLGDAQAREELIAAFEVHVLRRGLAYGLGEGWFSPFVAEWWRRRLSLVR